jgi:imidazolonepropionase-like amidohydrolase
MEHLFGLLKISTEKRPELFDRLRTFAVWQVPTLTLWQRDSSMRGSLEPAMELAGAMARAGVPMLAGTDTGDAGVEPGTALHDELELLVKAGLTPMQALQAATQNAARFFDEEENFGTVQKGRSADLVILDANPLADIRNTRRIYRVIVGGTEVPRRLKPALPKKV